MVNVDLLIKGGLALTSVVSLALGMVQSDRTEKKNADQIKNAVKSELANKQRHRKLGS